MTAGQPDLFTYPRAPGFKERTTSKEAAVAVREDAKLLRDLVLAAYQRAGSVGLTADACAKLLNRSVLAVRPRVSELVKTDKLVATERREKNGSGMSARVWRIAPCR